ncbi:MAG: hypothetical protein P4L27_04010 [Ignavibacteriaceae bacterium]|nr:hypothetical protein [Ignavibacteriaceae bacterium]
MQCLKQFPGFDNDTLGNEVTNIVNEYKPAGSYEVTFDSSNLGSGVYFYLMKSGDFAMTKKLILMKYSIVCIPDSV